MRGSVTELMKNRGYGCILGEDGCMVYFDEKALDGMDIRALSIGAWVEYEEQCWGERIRAVKVRPIPSSKIAIANRH
jgi:hypothetical protein